jgi:predicted Zn-dependent protease
MTGEERQFMLTAAWLFVRHGRSERARVIMEALLEEDPRDGVSAAALAELLLAAGEGERALRVIRSADFPAELSRAEAILETRALEQTGRITESQRRWQRYLASKKGDRRSWISN